MSSHIPMITTSARLILLCGLPGAGKTTLARRMEDTWPVVRLCPDEWMADLGIDLFAGESRDRLEARLTRLALSLLERGQSVILEYGFWGRSERDLKRGEARRAGAAIDLYYLNPPVEEMWRRLDARNQNITHRLVHISQANFTEWIGLFQPPDARELALYDRSALVPDAHTFALDPWASPPGQAEA